MNKESKISLICTLICVFILAWMPSSISSAYVLTIGYCQIRMNIWMSVILLVIAQIFDFRYRKKWLNYEIIYVVFLCYVLIRSLLSAAASSNSAGIGAVLDAMLTLVIPFAIYLKLTHYSEQENIRLIKMTIVIVGLGIAGQVIVFSFAFDWFWYLMGWTSRMLENMRASTTIGAATVTALYLFCILVLCFIEISKKNRTTPFYLFSTIIIMISLILTQTRSALILLCIFAIILVMFSDIKSSLKYLILFLVPIAFVIWLQPGEFTKIFDRFFTDNSSASNTARMRLFTEGIALFKDQPILGTGNGFGIKRLSNMDYFPSQIGNPHNQHLGILMESGMIGYAIYIFFMACMISNFIKRSAGNKKVKFLSWGIVIYFIIGFMFESTITVDIRIAMGFWIMISWLAMISKEKQQIT